jgi:predicted O-methyltransferase YrrM
MPFDDRLDAAVRDRDETRVRRLVAGACQAKLAELALTQRLPDGVAALVQEEKQQRERSEAKADPLAAAAACPTKRRLRKIPEGRDGFSAMSLDELLLRLPPGSREEVSRGWPDADGEALAEVYRWVLRGLPPGPACRKVRLSRPAELTPNDGPVCGETRGPRTHHDFVAIPEVVADLLREAKSLGFRLSCDPLTGSLLRILAASKPGGNLLELGTGVGVSTAWLLDGLSPDARLTSVDSDGRVQEVARRHLGGDPRVAFQTEDAGPLLGRLRPGSFDLIFADAWPGKFDHLGEALRLLRPGGLYVVDDLRPGPTCPEGHGDRVGRFLADLRARDDLVLARLDWASGVAIVTRRV